MKRISKEEDRVQRYLRPLYLDDYDELIELLSRGGFKLKVTADDFELDGPEEIGKLNQNSVKNLQMSTLKEEDQSYQSYFNQLRVGIRQSQASVYFDETDRGRALEVLELLKKKTSRLRIFIHWFLSSATLVASLTILAFLKLHDLPKLPNNLFALVALVFLFIAPTFWWWWPERSVVVLILKRRAAAGSFFQRKKDDLRMLGIGALIGAVLTFSANLALQALIRFLWPPSGTGH